MMRLTNAIIDMELAPEFGARIVSLKDRRTGRDWLVSGDCIGDASNGAIYGGSQARGWDECFPTIAPCRHPVDGSVMRDHGDLWGRPWTCQKTGQTVICEYVDTDYRFCRHIELDDHVIRVTYEVENRKAGPLVYLWSQHCLLATTPDDRIELQGFKDFTVSGGVLNGEPVPQHSFAWPKSPLVDTSLDEILPPDARFALKAYGRATGMVSAKVQGLDSAIVFQWNADQIAHIGLWLDYGGWPENAPVHQLALEPTTAPTDHLEAAEATSQMRQIAPGSTDSWTINITLIHHSDHGGPADVG